MGWTEQEHTGPARPAMADLGMYSNYQYSTPDPYFQKALRVERRKLETPRPVVAPHTGKVSRLTFPPQSVLPRYSGS